MTEPGPPGGAPLPIRIVDAIFERGVRRSSRAAFVAMSLAVAVHTVFWWWARRREPSLEEWSAALAARIHAELVRREVVELLPPQPAPAPTPETSEPRVARRARPSPAVNPKRVSPPAQAGRIIAQEPRPDTPVDLTGDAFVTGRGAFAGGTTTADGTNQVAVSGARVDPKAPPTTRPGQPDRARAVALNNDEWRCPWPAEADTEQIDSQSVIIRVRVRADGTAASARLVADPGHGFGQAAVACALTTRFVSARDAAGRPIEAESPPIRVRFTR